MKRKILALLLMSVSFTACKKSDTTKEETPGTCPGGIAPGGCFPAPKDCSGVLCTAYFAQIELDVTKGGAPVTLDSFIVTDLAGKPLPLSPSGLLVYGPAGGGRYVVMSDAWMAGHQNNFYRVIAKGYIGGATVFSEQYDITTDCCHVSKTGGKDSIVLP